MLAGPSCVDQFLPNPDRERQIAQPIPMEMA